MRNINRQLLNNKSGIYLIKNKINGKQYVGSSVNLYYRLKYHLTKLRKNKHHNVYLQRSFNKYTEFNFESEILEFCNKPQLRSREKYYIDLYKSEYNIQDPVEYFIQENTKRKISKTLKKRYKNNEIKAFNHPNKMISLIVFDFNYNLIGNYKSISDCCRKIKFFNKNTLKGIVKRNIPFYKNHIIIPFNIVDKNQYVLNYFKNMSNFSCCVLEKNIGILEKNDIRYNTVKRKLSKDPLNNILYKDSCFYYLGINMPSIK